LRDMSHEMRKNAKIDFKEVTLCRIRVKMLSKK
jgi:hypothetical protein